MATQSKKVLILLLMSFSLSACLKYAHHHGDQYKVPSKTMQGAVTGLMTGAVVGAAIGNPASMPLGMLAGTTTGGLLGYFSSNETGYLARLQAMGFHVIRYGDHLKIILPTDQYFFTDTAELREDRYPWLLEVAGFLQYNTEEPITVSAYSDDVGSEKYKLRLTFKQAQAVMSYLWAHGVDNRRLRAVGGGMNNDVANNETVVGSGFNRRIEISTKIPLESSV